MAIFSAAPSAKRLRDVLGIDEDKARAIRAVLDGSADLEAIPAVDSWLRQCYHRPRDEELAMCAADALMGGFGIEAIRGDWLDSYHCDIQAVYVNMGDTYAGTIVYDHKTDRVTATTVGDWVESAQNRGIL